MTWGLAIGVFTGIVAGAYAHELAHAWMVRLLGGEYAIDWWRITTHYDFEDDRAWRYWAVNMAPYPIAAVGWVLSLFVLLPEYGATPATAFVLLFTVLMTIGGRDDFSIVPVEQSTEETAP